jgi:hypothetical protein
MNSTTDHIAELLNQQMQPNDYGWILVNFVLCLLLGFGLRTFYLSHAQTITGKTHVASTLPLLSCIVFLVILIVKSSLALSLGLVGALSIVRFRTPIKEPEELVYLFLSIAIGLGFGAGQSVITIFITGMLMLVVHFWIPASDRSRDEFNFVVRWCDPNVDLGAVTGALKDHVEELKLVRVDRSSGASTALFLLTFRSGASIDAADRALRSLDSASSISAYEGT